LLAAAYRNILPSLREGIQLSRPDLPRTFSYRQRTYCSINLGLLAMWWRLCASPARVLFRAFVETWERKRLMSRTERDKSHDKLSRLSSAAELEFTQVGLGAASLEAIAEQASVSKQLIYNKFGGKNGLYAAVQNATRSRLFDILVQRACRQTIPLSAPVMMATLPASRSDPL